MRRPILAALGLLTLWGYPLFADHAGTDSGYWVDADVVRVEPIVAQRTVNRPRQVCDRYADAPRTRYRDFDRRYPSDPGSNPVASILGGVVGGLIGHQFGGGRGKKALTVAGALAGASIANRAARHARRYEYEPRLAGSRCWDVDDYATVNELEGYRVTYRYQDRTFVRRMDEHPGDHVRVRVQVSPEF